MGVRKTSVGDLYLSASIIFIYLTFIYYGFGQNNGWIFLLVGMLLAVFGAYTKNVLKIKEKIEGKKIVKVKRKKKTRK